MPSPPLQSESRRHARIIAAWLLLGCALVAATLVVGGVTRLTGSGLSMVDWEPVSGVVPPLSAEEWEREFAAYRDSPEYRLVNRGMSLAEFKRIFWFEYAHRMLGRVIGLVFIIPFAVFLLRRMIPRSLIPRLLLLFALGGAQGLLGWWMVRSGLVDIPRVSPYRLTAHLALAVLVYALTLWTALSLLRPGVGDGVGGGAGDGDPGSGRGAGLRRGSAVVLGLAALTLLSGGFVAGLDAGLIYNTFPKMGNGWIPPDLFGATPWWLSPFEDRTTAQFNHRILAIVLLAGVTAHWWACARRAPAPARTWAHAGFAAAWAQAALGVATLLLFVPISLAALHQANALVLFTALLGVTFELGAKPPRAAPRGRGRPRRTR
ncbi:MAG: heme A synthase [Gemmatimonadales bacterium]|nr:heme A synthase [Gemmatimonadales bacterium]MYG49616.1 heme A synthase [Gemmatimonadales bacterium]MYK01490.1 heme A synthase [Candidatus Palauibacter ramosifaciens]